MNTMKTIQAIQTHYNGYHFRSRLEARWAVFFDALGIEYKYEPQGFTKDTADGVFHYLPDFYLPKQSLWVEVKGVMTNEEACKLGEFLDWGCPLPDFDYSFRGTKGGFVVLGDIPNPENLVFHKMIRHDKGLCSNYFMFTSRGALKIVDEEYVDILGFFTPSKVSPDYFQGFDADSKYLDPSPVIIKSYSYWEKVKNAYLKARQARFEHGETPTPIRKMDSGLSAFDSMILAAPESPTLTPTP
jgi:hypothetical protein